MQTNAKKEKVNVYRVGGLTLLQLMAILAVLGIVATWVLRQFFA